MKLSKNGARNLWLSLLKCKQCSKRTEFGAMITYFIGDSIEHQADKKEEEYWQKVVEFLNELKVQIESD